MVIFCGLALGQGPAVSPALCCRGQAVESTGGNGLPHQPHAGPFSTRTCGQMGPCQLPHLAQHWFSLFTGQSSHRPAQISRKQASLPMGESSSVYSRPQSAIPSILLNDKVGHTLTVRTLTWPNDLILLSTSQTPNWLLPLTASPPTAELGNKPRVE